MALWTLAVKNGAGLTGNLGEILALGTDQSAIQAITADAYPQLNDTSGDWDDDVQPGWWLTARGSLHGFTLSATRPLSDLETLKREIILLDTQLSEWAIDVERLSPPHRAWQRDFGHDALASGHECSYLICRDTSITIANRTTWCGTMRAGASDGSTGRIASAEQFYALFTTRATFGDAHQCWVDPADPSTPLALNALHTVTGTIPAMALDNLDWVEALTG